MGKRDDPLIRGAKIAIKTSDNGSFKTQHNHIKEAKRFVITLRELGYGVKKWSNISNKHVGAVVNHWKINELAPATIKEYLSGVRTVCRLYGNNCIHDKNNEFGVENRTYITNQDKSVPQEVYENVVSDLKSSADIDKHRVAAQLQLERELGLRTEEACKFNPEQAVFSDGRVFIQHGTKGGRERFINEISDKAGYAINYVRTVIDGNNLIPGHMTEKQWSGKYYRTIRAHGISKAACGASGHGCRHAYAQERYAKLTGFQPPCKFESREDFKSNAEQIAGKEWQNLDRDARQLLKAELGHGPDRDDVVSQYLGSV
ncbi:Putative integrase, phage related [Desulfonema limicola]|uniref:Integrase, phage related n=1 Tax=Desulfonema limicola TaxID=45656 RepID=A0A975B4P1_9BACT|nr:integrase domain-containing protein [Desulfonema limicola]QTA78684.1 Putative integrase, phage related [Desulfonema limicola]